MSTFNHLIILSFKSVKKKITENTRLLNTYVKCINKNNNKIVQIRNNSSISWTKVDYNYKIVNTNLQTSEIIIVKTYRHNRNENSRFPMLPNVHLNKNDNIKHFIIVLWYY